MSPLLFTFSSTVFGVIMAKGNPFLGYARGALGDIVLYRSGGEQVSRARNRHPHNPRSNGQLYQRAIMATVMAFYSFGREIFDHSFEGLDVSASQSRFMRLNLRRLRAAVSQDIDGSVPVEQQQGRVTPPGLVAPVIFPWVVSQGSLTQRLFTFDRGNPPDVDPSFTIAQPLNNESVADYSRRVGLIPGDVYTILGAFMADQPVVYQLPDVDSPYARVGGSQFFYLRLIARDNLLSITDAVQNFGQLFTDERSKYCLADALEDLPVRQPVTTAELFIPWSNIAIGLIRSRKNSPLRSPCTLEVIPDAQARCNGLASSYLLPAWQQSSQQLGDSDLILEGST